MDGLTERKRGKKKGTKHPLVVRGDYRQRPLLNLLELADLLDVSRHTVHAWMKNNLLPIPHIKLPRRVLFRRDDVDKWLASREIKPLSAF